MQISCFIKTHRVKPAMRAACWQQHLDMMSMLKSAIMSPPNHGHHVTFQTNAHPVPHSSSHVPLAMLSNDRTQPVAADAATTTTTDDDDDGWILLDDNDKQVDQSI